MVSHNSVQNNLDHIEPLIRKSFQAVTNAFYHNITNPNTVRDFPEDYLKMIATDPANPTQGPWRITLQPHIAVPFMGGTLLQIKIWRNCKYWDCNIYCYF